MDKTPSEVEVARLLWDEAGQGGVIFETQERRYQVARAIVALFAAQRNSEQGGRDDAQS